MPRRSAASGQRVMNSLNDIVDEDVIVSVEKNLHLMLLHEAMDSGLFAEVPCARAAASIIRVQGIARIACGGMMDADEAEPLSGVLQRGLEPTHLLLAQGPFFDLVYVGHQGRKLLRFGRFGIGLD